MGSGLIVGSRGQRVLATYFLISSPPCEGAGEGTASFPNCLSLIITNTYRAGMGAARGTIHSEDARTEGCPPVVNDNEPVPDPGRVILDRNHNDANRLGRF